MIVSGKTSSVLLSLLLLSLVSADGGQKTPVPANTKDEESFFIKPAFFDFNKEIESIFPTQTERSVSEEQSPDYVLEEGVSLERDYDFYSDVEGSESEMAPVTARAGYSPR